MPITQPYTDTNSGLHYDLRLDIEPKSRFLNVSGSIAYHSPGDRVERARFYLHRQLRIQRLEGRRVLGYQFQIPGDTPLPYQSQAAVLDVYFSPPLRRGETVLLSFEYDGTLTEWPAESANVIGEDWVELGSSFPWFPLQYQNQPSDLTFTLKVNLPGGYQTASYGRGELLGGSWYFNWPHPTSDIVVAVGKTLTSDTFESDSNQVILHTTTLDKKFANQLGEELLWTLDRFSGWFGRTRPRELTVIESPRKLGAGYSRRGLIVLAGVDEQTFLDHQKDHLRRLGHESAHAWWWDAPKETWEDWLNESFAEYSGLLALRERYGNQTFEQSLQQKRERLNGLQPLWEFARSDTSTPEKQTQVERHLYDQGPLLLHELAQRIGSQRFLELCRARLWSGVTATEHLLDLLEELEDAKTRIWFEARLKGEA